IVEKLKEYSIKNKKIIKFCDQDTLNKVIDEKKINLHPKYNFMDTWWGNYYIEYESEDLLNYKEAKNNPVIVHLTGPKPTQKGCKNFMTEKWWSYARVTDIYYELEQEYKNSKEFKKKSKLLSQIFGIKNECRYKDKWKVVTILGFKFKTRVERAKKIFIVFNTAFIGDILLNNTLVQNIKYFYPESKVIFVTQPQFRDVALYQKGVDDVVTFNKKKDNNLFGLLKFVKNFPYRNIFASFVLYSNDRNLILAKLLGSKHIMTEPAGLLTKLIPTREKYKRNTYTHKKDIATGLIESLTGRAILDLPLVYDAPLFNYPELKSDKEYVSITTTSKYKPKDMPLDTCCELIKLINKSGKIPVMLGAGPIAREYVKDLQNNGCNEFLDLTDKTDFVELANALRQSKALISVDTGTMHMGNALNVPTVAIFYSHGIEMWAPQEGMYKSKLLSGNPSAKEIFKAFEEV
ncbi:MAG: glycosyltransferase family 9 protein, partial [Candidatus Gastranaerophilaceae bacterium]